MRSKRNAAAYRLQELAIPPKCRNYCNISFFRGADIREVHWEVSLRTLENAGLVMDYKFTSESEIELDDSHKRLDL